MCLSLRILLAINWGNPLAGRPESGQDYRKHLEVVDALQGWTFFQPGDVQNAIDWSVAVEAEWPGRVSTSAQVRPTTDPAELARFVTELKTAPAGINLPVGSPYPRDGCGSWRAGCGVPGSWSFTVGLVNPWAGKQGYHLPPFVHLNRAVSGIYFPFGPGRPDFFYRVGFNLWPVS